MSGYKEEYANQIIAKNEHLVSQRKNWDVTWQEISDYVIPRKSSINTVEPIGEVRTEHLFNTKAEEANNILAAGQLAYVCPANETWFKFQTTARGTEKAEDLTMHYDNASEVGFSILANSNFYLEIHETLIDRGSMGTCCIFSEYDPTQSMPFIFQSVPCGTYSIDEDKYGMVDTVYREMKMTARQLAQKFGKEALCEDLIKSLTSPEPSEQLRKFHIIHAVEPNEEWNSKGDSQFPIKSCYVCKDFKHVLEEGGYYEMPYFVSRFLKSNIEMYGRSPAISKLPDIKSANKIRRDILISSEKEANPPILASDESSNEIDNRAGGVTYWDTRNPMNKPEVWQGQSDIREAKEELMRIEQGIDRAFFVDMFAMFQDLPSHVTTSQIMEMANEKMTLFSPTFARLVQEIFTPLLQRMYGLMLRNGHIDPPPSEEDLGQFKVHYVSKISLAVKALQNRSFQQALELLLPLGQEKPELWDYLNLGNAVKQTFSNIGLPVEYRNTEDEVEEIREERQAQQEAMMQAEQEAQQAQAFNQATQGVKNLQG